MFECLLLLLKCRLLLFRIPEAKNLLPLILLPELLLIGGQLIALLDWQIVLSRLYYSWMLLTQRLLLLKKLLLEWLLLPELPLQGHTVLRSRA
jgi:hypothetical protein